MGTSAQFEEKTFEGFANAELTVWQYANGVAPAMVYSPGQKLEELLGFDVMTRLDPDSALYRALFGGIRGGAGVAPSFHAHRPTGAVHGFYNLFFQYKRPTFFATAHRNAYWAKGEAHYAFETTDRRGFAQLKTLIGLERALNGLGLVRYVSPTVYTDAGLQGLAMAGKVLATSTFVSPALLERKKPGALPASTAGVTPSQLDYELDKVVYHEWWRYALDDPTRGVPNPGEEFVEVGTAADIREEVREKLATTDQALGLGRLGAEASELLGGYVEMSWRAVRLAEESIKTDGRARYVEELRRHDELTRMLQQMEADRGWLVFEGGPLVEPFLDVAALAHATGTSWTIASAGRRD